MLATIIISCLTFVGLTVSVIVFPSVKIFKVKIGLYWLIAMLGAALLLVLRCVPINEILSELTANTAVNPLKILTLFFCMTFISVFLDEAGFFSYLAKKTAAFAKTSQIKLFFTFYILTSFLTVFTSNDIVILTLTPFICYFCKNAKIAVLPYLVAEFAAANTWSMALIIGNPTNVYLGISAGISFTEYFKVMAIPTFVSGAAELIIMLLLFRKKLKQPLGETEKDIPKLNVTEAVLGIVALIGCLIFMVISGYVNIEMWLISAIFALILLLSVIVFSFINKDAWLMLKNTFIRLPWQLIPFVMSMFVIVICFGYNGVTDKIMRFLSDGDAIFNYGFASFISANLINNIPMSILFSGVVNSLPAAFYLKAVYATIIGSNVGAFLTPIGALAGIMFTGITQRLGVKYGFKEFIKYGIIISIPTLFVALIILYLII